MKIKMLLCIVLLVGLGAAGCQFISGASGGAVKFAGNYSGEVDGSWGKTIQINGPDLPGQKDKDAAVTITQTGDVLGLTVAEADFLTDCHLSADINKIGNPIFGKNQTCSSNLNGSKQLIYILNCEMTAVGPNDLWIKITGASDATKSSYEYEFKFRLKKK